MNIAFKIVKNEKLPRETAEEPLHCKARLVWQDAVLSDGSVCDKEMLDKLFGGVDLSNYAPPLLIQHDWDVRNVVGKMTALKLEDDTLLAEFDVLDAEAKAKISEGIWDSISLSYDLPDFKILECSVVAVPAIPGAKIEAMAEAEEAKEEAEDKEAEEQPAEEDKAEEAEEPKEEKPAEENACKEDDPEKKKPEEVKENALSNNENIVIENGRVNNAATIDRLIKTVESLQRQNKELSDLIVRNDRKQKAEKLLHEWISNGKTLPANKEQEMSFVLSLNDDQLKAYTNLKQSVVCNAAPGKRISNPVKPAQSRTEEFIEGYKRFIEGGLK